MIDDAQQMETEDRASVSVYVKGCELQITD